MSCTNLKIGRLLPGFVSGEVTAEEIELFQEHLLECDACFQNFHFIFELEKKLKTPAKIYYKW